MLFTCQCHPVPRLNVVYQYIIKLSIYIWKFRCPLKGKKYIHVSLFRLRARGGEIEKNTSNGCISSGKKVRQTPEKLRLSNARKLIEIGSIAVNNKSREHQGSSFHRESGRAFGRQNDYLNGSI